MTENKRFEIKMGEFEEENIVDNLNKMTICEISDMCKKMNELAEENQEFRKRTKELIAVSLDYPTINLDLIADGIKSLRELIE